jgi:glycosyltransferase involved in cell wall biosynthesis
MKIVYIYPQFAQRAGTERILIDKMNYLAEKEGYEIVMLTYEQGIHPIAYPLSPKVKHVDLDVRFYPLYAHNRWRRILKLSRLNNLLKKRYNAFIENYRPDIVVATTYSSIVLKLIVDCPINYIRVLESHIGHRYILSNDPANQKDLIHWLGVLKELHIVEKKARKCDLLVALNHDDAHDWSRFLKTTIVTNVVHLNPTGKFSNHDKKNVIFVGRYVEQKGIPDLFRIWQFVSQKHSDWHLHLYGDGELRDQLQKDADLMQINIHIHQSDSQIFDRYLDSSIIVLTSIYEPFGLVMPEAMSCGLPAVAFDCPSGPAHIVTDGVDGFLIRNRDIKTFADRVCQLIEYPELRKKMGLAAIESSKRFSAERIMPQWERLFEELSPQKNK